MKNFLIISTTTVLILYGLLVIRNEIKKQNFANKRNKIHIQMNVVEQHSGALTKDLLEFMKIRDVKNGTTVNHIKTLETGELLYDKTYQYDHAGLRNRVLKQKGKEHIILSGCSAIFGEGVNEDETVSHYLNQLDERDVFNFGIAGAGPHDHVELLKLMPSEYVKSQKGTYIFFYWDDHLPRATLHPSYLMWAGEKRPYFDLVGEGLPEYIGMSGESSNWKNFINSKKANLDHELVALTKKDGTSFTDKDIKLTAGIIALIKKEYQLKYPEGKFFLSFYPFFHTDKTHKRKITKHLKSFDVDILELGEFDLKNLGPISIPHDGHPLPIAHKLLAERLNDLLN